MRRADQFAHLLKEDVVQRVRIIGDVILVRGSARARDGDQRRREQIGQIGVLQVLVIAFVRRRRGKRARVRCRRFRAIEDIVLGRFFVID